MQQWFVYYKLDPATARAVEPRLRGMQAKIGSAGGVRPRLLCRADASGDAVTLLEVYEGIGRPEPFEATLAAAVAGAGLPESLLAQRRTERFEEF